MGCSDMRGADLTGAMLSGADFGQTLLDGAILRAANLSNADFQATATCIHTVFEKAQMSYASLEKIDASHANFDSAVLYEASLDKAKLTGATFVKADLSDAKLLATSAVGADFREANLFEALFARKPISRQLRRSRRGPRQFQARQPQGRLLCGHVRARLCRLPPRTSRWKLPRTR